MTKIALPILILALAVLLGTPVAAQPALPEPFVDVSATAGIDAQHQGSWDEYADFQDFTDDYQMTGQAWGDYDNDGLLDLFVTGNLAPNVLYRNNGDGTFAVSPLSASVALPASITGGAVWIDYDNDGWQDLYVLAMGPNTLFHNERGQGFTDVTDAANVGDAGKGTTAAWADYDADGYLDLYVANWSCYPQCDPVDHTLAQDRLYHNNGDGTFVDVTALLDLAKSRGASFTAGFLDYDNDGDQDLYVVNDKLQNPVGNVLWRNDGPGCDGWCWTDISADAAAAVELHGMGLATGDYDQDQDLDIFVSNMVDPGVLLANQGDGAFAEQAAALGLPAAATNAVGWATAFLDYDNDGWQDLLFTTTEFIKFNDLEGAWGMLFPFPNALYRNQDGAFDDSTPASWRDDPRPSMGAALADYDQDGRIDFVTGDWNRGYTLYHNSGAVGGDNGWVGIRLVGGGLVNRDAIGARVTVTTDDGRSLMAEVNSGSNLGGGSDRTLHFGVGDAAISRLTIRWPDGLVQELQDVPHNRIWNIGYPIAAVPAAPAQVDTAPTPTSTPVSPTATRIATTTPIVEATAAATPTAVPTATPTSTTATGTATEDNGETGGLDTLFSFFTLDAGPPAESFVDVSARAGITATHEGSWRMFKLDFDTGYLGIGQAWGDYDNDGLPDLYVTGNLTTSTLFHNEGDGTFTVPEMAADVALPDRLTGGTVWADYDNDGWRDLYVLAHGANVLFRNDQGEGFTDVTARAGVGDGGKGSSAAWGDYDNDGFLDIYVTNWSCMPECDPVDLTGAEDVLYHNNGDGTFTDVSDLLVREKLQGAGFATSFVDYDDDGDLDIYVVNDALMNPIGNVLFQNDGPGCDGWCWSDASVTTGAGIVIEGMGLAVGDYDNDLDLDFFFPNMVNPSALMRNEAGQFVEIAEDAGVQVGPSEAVGWGTEFFDYDNDGWLDLYLGATEFRDWDMTPPPDGMHFPHRNFLYHNQGDGTFVDSTPPSWLENPQRSMGSAYADFNDDGWVDFVSGDWNTGFRLFQNQGVVGTDNNWLTLRLQGGGSVNRDAIGARAYVATSDGRVLMQEVRSGSSLGAGSDTALHFGLGAATVDELMIRWPNGNTSSFRSAPLNQVWRIRYQE